MAAFEPPRILDPPRGFDAVCVGETMVMVTPSAGRLRAEATYVLRPGGAESTVAMYLASLGHRTAWASRLGTDPLGDLVLAEVGRPGVDTSLVQRTPGRPTGVYFKDPSPEETTVYYYRSGSAAATMDAPFAARLAAVPARVRHLSGVTPALSRECQALVQALVTAPRDGLLSFDVNYRPALWVERDAAAELLAIARACDVVFVGLDEARGLWGTAAADEVRGLIAAPRFLVVKDGALEATAFDGGDRCAVPAPEVDVVEPVGAGDAFAAGWLAGALRGFDPATRLRLAHLVAGVALRSVGDFGPVPGTDELCAALGITPDQWNKGG